MIGLYNKDSSFFSVVSPDIPLDFQVLTDDIISFSVEEDQGKMTSGSIQIYDPSNYYSSVLRMGAKLDIAWGYKKPDLAPESLFTNIGNPQELKGIFERMMLRGVIMSPSGSGNNHGEVLYNINFYGREFISGNKLTQKVYYTGTKQTVVHEVLQRMGVLLSFVNFKRGNELNTSTTAVRQWESDYRFLLRVAREWGAFLKIGYSPSGDPVGVFIDPDYVADLKYMNIITGATMGSEITLDYKEGARNVIDYTWQNHQGESGTGDNIQISYVNGKPVFNRYVTKGETVIVYRLKPEIIEEKLKKATDVSKQIQLMKSWLKASTFEEVKWAFVKVKETTAPQGLGYSLSVNMIGNPALMAPLRVKLNKGFPSLFGSSKVNFVCRKVSHNIDRNGYFCKLDIADSWTVSGGSLI